jgi:hypothetical protein
MPRGRTRRGVVTWIAPLELRLKSHSAAAL